MNNVGDQRASSERGRLRVFGGNNVGNSHKTKEGAHEHPATKKRKQQGKNRRPETKENRRVNHYRPSTRAIGIALDFGGTHPLYCIKKPWTMRRSKWRKPLDYAPRMKKLLKRVRVLGVPPRLRDHMRCILKGKTKGGSFWNKIPGCAERAFCSFCKLKKNIEILESEQHICLDCENNVPLYIERDKRVLM